MDDPFQAVESEDVAALRRVLDAGFDVNTEDVQRWTLLHLAIDVEIDLSALRATPPYVDMTALLLARGADPDLGSDGGAGPSARMLASESGHWLAVELMERISPQER